MPPDRAGAGGECRIGDVSGLLQRFGYVVLIIGVAVSACGSGTSASSTCGPVVTERLHPESSVHVLPSARVEYLSLPPTSGPHTLISGAAPTAMIDEIDPPLQVGYLERGYVLVQFGPGTDDAAQIQAELERYVGSEVVVARNSGLPSPIVLTSWTRKQECDGLDTEAIDRFIGENVGNGPEQDG